MAIQAYVSPKKGIPKTILSKDDSLRLVKSLLVEDIEILQKQGKLSVSFDSVITLTSNKKIPKKALIAVFCSNPTDLDPLIQQKKDNADQ